MGQFVLLVIQLENLTKHDRASIVHTKTGLDYVKTGNKRGRPSKAAAIANEKMRIDQFYTVDHRH